MAFFPSNTTDLSMVRSIPSGLRRWLHMRHWAGWFPCSSGVPVFVCVCSALARGCGREVRGECFRLAQTNVTQPHHVRCVSDVQCIWRTMPRLGTCGSAQAPSHRSPHATSGLSLGKVTRSCSATSCSQER